MSRHSHPTELLAGIIKFKPINLLKCLTTAKKPITGKQYNEKHNKIQLKKGYMRENLFLLKKLTNISKKYNNY
jgi:hypothetical protein